MYSALVCLKLEVEFMEFITAACDHMRWFRSYTLFWYYNIFRSMKNTKFVLYKSAGVPVAKSQGILWVIVGPTVQTYATAWEHHTSLHSLHKAK